MTHTRRIILLVMTVLGLLLSAPSAMAEVRLDEPFTSNTRWALDAGASIGNGHLAITSSGAWPGAYSTVRWDATNARTSVKLLDAPSGTESTLLMYASGVAGNRIYAQRSGTNVLVREYSNNVLQSAASATIPYSAITMKYFAFQADGNTTKFQTSTDGVTYTTHKTWTRVIALNDVRLGLTAFGTGAVARFDDVRIETNGPPPDTTPPSAPSNVHETADSATSVTVDWTAATDNVGVTAHDIWYERNGTGWFQGPQPGGSATSATIGGLACGETITVDVYAKDAAGNTSRPPGTGTATTATCPVGNGQPVGQTGWNTVVFNDDFTGTAFSNRWARSWFNGGNMNGTSTSVGNTAVANGEAQLQLSSPSVGSLINTDPSQTGGAGFEVNGDWYAEARVYFPGNGTTIYNFPAWWTDGQPSWPMNAEFDIAEGLGVMTSNYHAGPCADCDTDRDGSGQIPGTWSNAFHTYAMHHDTVNNRAIMYWDGVEVWRVNLTRPDAPHFLIFNVGNNGNGGPTVTGAGSTLKVDYVKVWKR